MRATSEWFLPTRATFRARSATVQPLVATSVATHCSLVVRTNMCGWAMTLWSYKIMLQHGHHQESDQKYAGIKRDWMVPVGPMKKTLWLGFEMIVIRFHIAFIMSFSFYCLSSILHRGHEVDRDQSSLWILTSTNFQFGWNKKRRSKMWNNVTKFKQILWWWRSLTVVCSMCGLLSYVLTSIEHNLLENKVMSE